MLFRALALAQSLDRLGDQAAIILCEIDLNESDRAQVLRILLRVAGLLENMRANHLAGNSSPNLQFQDFHLTHVHPRERTLKRADHGAALQHRSPFTAGATRQA